MWWKLETYSRHAIELRHDAFLATSDGDWVVEYSIFSVVAICLFCWLELVVTQDILDHLLFLLTRLLCVVDALGGFGSA